MDREELSAVGGAHLQPGIRCSGEDAHSHLTLLGWLLEARTQGWSQVHLRLYPPGGGANLGVSIT